MQEAFGQFSQHMESRLSEVQSAVQRGAEPPPPDTPEQAPDYDEDPEAYAQWALNQAVEKQVEERLGQALQPLQQRMEEDRLRRETDGFLSEHSEYEDPQKARQLVGNAQEWAQDIAGHLGSDAISRIAREPAFLELVHQAEQNAAAGEAETPAGKPREPGQQVTPEGGGGAAGGTAPLNPERETAQRILHADDEPDVVRSGWR
jgi:hypothetical protein